MKSPEEILTYQEQCMLEAKLEAVSERHLDSDEDVLEAALKEASDEFMNEIIRSNSKFISVNIYEELFTPEEFSKYANLMQSINAYDYEENDPELLEYEKQIEVLNEILDERCSKWSSDNYFINKAEREDLEEPWILYVKDNETGVTIDVEDTFKTSLEACERGLQLEKQIQ
jgi:hypothetical protein